MFLKKSFSEAKEKGLLATKRGDKGRLVKTLHIVHLKRRCGLGAAFTRIAILRGDKGENFAYYASRKMGVGVGGSFHQNCYFDEHPPPCGPAKQLNSRVPGVAAG